MRIRTAITAMAPYLTSPVKQIICALVLRVVHILVALGRIH